jgi:hypothetical protein
MKEGVAWFSVRKLEMGGGGGGMKVIFIYILNDLKFLNLILGQCIRNAVYEGCGTAKVVIEH